MRWVLRLRVYIIVTLAVLLIISAVMFSVLRATLPYATGYKNEIQNEISRQVGLPVEIESIDAAIHWFSPRLKLINVSVYNNEDSARLFHFREAFVQLDVIASIMHRDLIVEDIGMVGADISIERFSENEWSVQGIKFTSEGSNEMPESLLYMLKYSDYLLHDSRIFYWDHTNDQISLALTEVNIDVSNDFDNHNIKVSMLMPESYGQELSMVANLRGDFDSLNGEVYLETQKFDVDRWNQSFGLFSEYKLDTSLDVKLWLTLDDGHIEELTSQLAASDFQLKNNLNGNSWQTGFLATNIRYRENSSSRSLTISDFYFGENEQPVWPNKVDAYARVDDGEFYISAEYLDLQELQKIAAVFDQEAIDHYIQLKEFKLQGEVYNLYLKSESPKSELSQSGKSQVDASDSGNEMSDEMMPSQLLEGLELQATVNDLSVYDQLNNIFLSGFDASFTLKDKQLHLDVDSQDVVIEIPDLFRNAITATTLHGSVDVHQDDDGWYAESDEMLLANEHIDTLSRLDIWLPTDGDMFLDVQSDFFNAQGQYATRYLPVGVMSEALIDWLDMAITDGSVPTGQFVLHGLLSEFPFDNNDGVFQVVFTANKVNMSFLQDWPVLENASATVRFHNRSLQVTDATATTHNVRLFAGEAVINDLLNPHLKVITRAQTDNEKLQSYIWQSPLDEMLGDTMRLFTFSGVSHLNLSIDVPLDDEKVAVAVDGQLKFINGTVSYPALDYELENVDGVVNFTNDSISAKSVSATVQGEKVQLDAKTRKGRSGREAVFYLAGGIQADYLLQHYDWIPEDWISGKSLWSLAIEVPYRPKDYLVHITADTDFAGTALRLSDELFKPESDKVGFTMAIDVLDNYGLQVNATAHPLTSETNNSGASKSGAEKADSEKLPGTSETDHATVDNQATLFALRDDKNIWKINVKSDFVTGQAEFNEGLHNESTVQLNLDNIYLYSLFSSDASDDTTADDLLDPVSFPQLDISIDNLHWKEQLFNNVRLQTSWHEHGMLINRFSLDGPDMSLNARGTWLKSWRETQETVLQGDIISNDFGNSLTGLGFQRSINHGTARTTFEAKWPSAPYVFSLATAKGNASFELEKGEMLDVEPGAGGRLLGLMNIFKLTNRLVFDFDDVTHKGFSFDYIKGNYEFVNGNGALNNFDISAPAADVNMFGSIDLLKREYGLLMHVKPHTDTLTFAGGALLGGVAVGAGLALIQKVFDLGVIGHTVYSISGSWDDPVIDKIVEKTLDDDEEF